MSEAPDVTAHGTPEDRGGVRRLRREPITEDEMRLLQNVKVQADFYQSTVETNEKMGYSTTTCSIQQFALTNGGFWGPPTKTDCTGELGRCYENAQEYARTHDGVWYVEGFAVGPSGMVRAHAWCVDESGAVIDTTELWCNGTTAYFGTVLPMELVDEQVGDTIECPRVIDNWEKRYPLLQLVDGKPQKLDSPFAEVA